MRHTFITHTCTLWGSCCSTNCCHNNTATTPAHTNQNFSRRHSHRFQVLMSMVETSLTATALRWPHATYAVPLLLQFLQLLSPAPCHLKNHLSQSHAHQPHKAFTAPHKQHPICSVHASACVLACHNHHCSTLAPFRVVQQYIGARRKCCNLCAARPGQIGAR